MRMLSGHDISERRSCHLVGITRSSARYRAQPLADTELSEQLRAIAAQHPRFGYRRAHALLKRAGQSINHKRVARVWRITGLSLPRRRPRRRYKSQPVRSISQATRPNEVWTYDFVQDWCANGQRLKLLTVIDEFTRESLTIETRTSIKSRAVIEILERLTSERGAPAYLRSDNVLPSKASLSQRHSSPVRSGSCSQVTFYRSRWLPSLRGERPFTIVTHGQREFHHGHDCTQHKVSVPMEDPIIVYEVIATEAARLNGSCERVLPSGVGTASSW
ncbi:MAG: transposase [Pyrinomonadaceae bacterium]|nr:transposase [Pyrinomonadaceae bacterium]